jgi:hypothetical protein
MFIKDFQDFPANKTCGADNCQFHKGGFFCKDSGKNVGKWASGQVGKWASGREILLTDVLPFRKFLIKQKIPLYENQKFLYYLPCLPCLPSRHCCGTGEG